MTTNLVDAASPQGQGFAGLGRVVRTMADKPEEASVASGPTAKKKSSHKKKKNSSTRRSKTRMKAFASTETSRALAAIAGKQM